MEKIVLAESDRQLPRAVRGISRVLGACLVVWAGLDDPWVGGGPGFGMTQGGLLVIGSVLVGSSFLGETWNTRALMVVLSVGFVLVTAEIAARVLFSARYKPPYRLDERTLYTLVPGAVREHELRPVNGGKRILYRINRDGFRGDELVEQPRLRVAVYGDSFIQAEFSPLEETFAEQLEQHLARRLGDGVEVVNAGVAGFGPDQALRKMEAELDSLAPEILVMGVFAGNDFGDPIRNKLFRLDDEGELVENDFRLGPEQRRALLVRNQELVLKRVVRDALRATGARLGLFALPASELEGMSAVEKVEFFFAQRVREYQEFVVEGDDEVIELAWDSYDADVSLEPEADSSRYKVGLMKAVLARMQRLADERGILFVLLPIPHPIDVGGHPTGEVDRAAHPDYRPRGLVSLLEGIAGELGIPVVDLYTPFSVEGSQMLYFTGGDDHWNAKGQDLGAEIVADFLMSGGEGSENLMNQVLSP
jgi:hypothetical protein